MLTSWLWVSLNFLAVAYFVFISLYYRNINAQEKNKVNSLRITLEEAELLIKKYQIQLQKVLGSVDTLNTELEDTKNDLKNIKGRYAHLKAEDDKHKSLIAKLQSKIESLV